MPWHGGWNNWWWVMPLGTVTILAVLLAFFWALARNEARWPAPEGDPVENAERILNERYARGEIGDEEFRHRSAVLRGSGTPGEGADRTVPS